jgi:hypothetical protein
LAWAKVAESYPEQYWHCWATAKGTTRIFSDLTFSQISAIAKKWQANTPFTIAGLLIKNQDDLTEFRIVRTALSTRGLDEKFAREHGSSAMQSEFLPFEYDELAEDFTDRLLFPESGAATQEPVNQPISTGNNLVKNELYGKGIQVRRR